MTPGAMAVFISINTLSVVAYALYAASGLYYGGG